MKNLKLFLVLALSSVSLSQSSEAKILYRKKFKSGTCPSLTQLSGSEYLCIVDSVNSPLLPSRYVAYRFKQTPEGLVNLEARESLEDALYQVQGQSVVATNKTTLKDSSSSQGARDITHWESLRVNKNGTLLIEYSVSETEESKAFRSVGVPHANAFALEYGICLKKR